MKLKEKIVKISNELKLEKDLEVSTGKNNSSYKAVGEAQIKTKIKQKELEYNISIIPYFELVSEPKTVEKKTVYNGKENIKTETHVFLKCVLNVSDLESDEDFFQTISFGQGIDNGDKAFGKANTYAFKYALMNLFKMATNDDEDIDNSKNNNDVKKMQKDVISIFNKKTKGFTEEQKKQYYKELGISQKEFKEKFESGDLGILESLIGLMEMS